MFIFLKLLFSFLLFQPDGFFFIFFFFLLLIILQLMKINGKKKTTNKPVSSKLPQLFKNWYLLHSSLFWQKLLPDIKFFVLYLFILFFFFFSALNRSFRCLLTSTVSHEKLADNIMEKVLYIRNCSSLAVFKLCLFLFFFQPWATCVSKWCVWVFST